MNIPFSSASLLRLVVLASLLLGLSLPLQARTQRQTSVPSLNYQLYIPAVLTVRPELQLHGYVLENGHPVAGVQVDLLRCGNSGSCSSDYTVYEPLEEYIYKSTVTDQNGLYNFTDVPSITYSDGRISYRTLFYNRDKDPKRLAYWINEYSGEYTEGTTRNAGDFDIADVSRIAPEDGVVLPQSTTTFFVTLHFQWTPRTSPPTGTTERYGVRLADGAVRSSSIINGPSDMSGEYSKEFRYCRDECGDPAEGKLNSVSTYTWRIWVGWASWATGDQLSGYGETLSPRSFTLPMR